MDSRSRVLLSPQRLDPRINQELADSYIALIHPYNSLCPIDEEARTPNSPRLVSELVQANREHFSDLRKELPSGYTLSDGLLLYKERLCVERHTPLCTQLIQEAHSQISSAHPSGVRTYQLLAPKYYWRGMEADCRRYVANCVVCRLSHSDQTKKRGLLHPLPIPSYPMQHVCMDFKEFPKDREGYDSILVVIDRLSKASVSIPCHKTIDSRGLAQLFIQWIYRFGHTPETIISDRGPQFISSFWKEFCRIIGVKIKLSTAYHKETDGQTEIMNRYIDQRLRPFVNFYQDNWSELLPLIDRAQLTLPHSSIGLTPYQVLFGSEPRVSWDWKTPKAQTPVEKLNHQDAIRVASRMEDAWKLAKDNMEKAQQRMMASANKHRREVDWDVNDRVYLSTKNLKSYRPSRKLANQWDGPFKVLEKVGNAYRLELPAGSQVYNVFAPDVLMKASDNPLPGQKLPEPEGHTIAENREWEVDKILASRLYKGKLKYQTSWVGYDPDPSWYPASNFIGSPSKLQEFHNGNPKAPGPPRKLSEWTQAWISGQEDYSHLADDYPVTKDASARDDDN